MPRKRPLIDKFLEKIEKTSTCWLWTASKNNNGYGRIDNFYAHRVAYELFIGIIPDDLEIDHLCHVRHCVNPNHLELVTHAENIRRRDQRAQRTHCPRGHEYTGKCSRGWNVCGTCDRERKRQSVS